MAIKIKRENHFVYLGITGFLNEVEKKRADDIYNVAHKEFELLKREIKIKPKIDSLGIWYLRGKLTNKLIERFKISDMEKRYYWLMLYDIAGLNVPDRAKKFHIQNDFHVANILAKYKLSELRKIGPWALWREILGSTKIMDDERIAKWATDFILKKKIQTRDSARPLLKFIRNRLKNLNTEILSEKELVLKLGEFKSYQGGGEKDKS